jgi:hypothetical protein
MRRVGQTRESQHAMTITCAYSEQTKNLGCDPEKKNEKPWKLCGGG